ELSVVAAVLASDLHVREADDDVAVRVGHDVELEHAQDGHPPRDPGVGVQRQRPGLDVPDQLRHVLGEAGGEHRHLQLHDPVPLARDASGVDLGVADVGAPVPEAGGAGGVGEGGRVGVVHGHGEQQREVWLGEAGREADEAGGEQARGGVAHAEHGEEEDEEGDAQEQEHAEGDQGADADAAAAPAASQAAEAGLVHGFGVEGRRCGGREAARCCWGGHCERRS
uniref:Uncharacterized protein n=1 Tax=Triticum urartu TaxID=4572 RepID=A0A8R7V6I4_TRIUA